MAVTGSPVESGSVAGRTGGSGVTVLPSSDYRYVSFTCCTLGTSITRVHCCVSETASCFLVERGALLCVSLVLCMASSRLGTTSSTS